MMSKIHQLRLSLLFVSTALTAAVVGANEAVEFNLVIDRPVSVSPGNAASFSCQLGSHLTPANNPCTFIAPDNRMLKANFQTGEVLNENDEPVSEWSALIDPDGRTCGLQTATLNTSALGEWSCRLDHDGENVPFHVGTFHLLNDDYVHDVRLPRHVVPQIYEVQMIPIVEEGNFTTIGFMRLHFRFMNDSSYVADKIVLHSKETLIHEDTVRVFDINGDVQIVGHEYDLEREFYIVHLGESMIDEVFLNDYTIEMSFVSILNDKLVGLYRSQYTDTETGEIKYLAVSQFEPTDARRAFPCLDEPDRKARFNAKVGHKSSMVALSNMDIVSTEDIPDLDGYVMTEFHQSDKMSTYLLAFVVAEFSNTPSPTDASFNIWHIPSKAGQAKFAADIGPQVLEFYEDYFGIPFPLPKMDMAAIPDFDAGAMENWGLITYRESTLLFDDQLSSEADREQVAYVIAHELAHQWFGNLVTMKWWTDLWLNEGFATYVEDIGTDFILPENQYKDRALITDVQHVLMLDSLETSFALSNTVTNPDYDLIFGSISYEKGNSIIRMMEAFITAETFRKGVNKYLTELDHGNADRIDLWNALNEVAHDDETIPSTLNVADIMESWTVKPGYPVVTVESNVNNILTLNQKRFFLNPELETTDDLWYIPLNAAYPGNSFADTKATEWFRNTRQQTMTVASIPYVLNVKETGFYRVNYQLENWIALIDALDSNHLQIDQLNRAQLFDDSLNLARAGQLDYEIALNLSSFLYKEMDLIPLEAGLNNLDYLDLMFRQSSQYDLLKVYLRNQLQWSYDSMDFGISPDDKYPDILRKTLLIDWMCLYGNEDCISRAQSSFAAWMTSSNPDSVDNYNIVHPDLKISIFSVAIREGGQEEFDFLLARLPNVLVDVDVRKVIYGLSSSTSVENLQLLLDMTIDVNSPIRSQDTRYVYRAVGKSDIGRRVQFSWLQDSYDEIKAYYGVLFSSMVKEITAGFTNAANTQEDIDSMQAFLDAHREDLGSSVIALEQGINTAQLNLLWMEANFQTIVDWLQDNQDPLPPPPLMTSNEMP